MPNHLNTSELFSSNPGEFLQRGGARADCTSDSAFNSSQSFSCSATNSQVMGSQMENSQSSSFDLFSQMMSQQQGYSQQNESTSSNFYMKYMSKPPLFQKENAPKKTSLPRKKSFQGMQELNRERAKERDDRDLINTFIAIVKECADEVKHAASSIKKDVDTNISETTTRTAAVMSKIANELAHHHRQLLDSLKTRENHEAKLQELMETIASKDAQIQLLESQLTTARTDRNEHLLKAMLDMYTEQQNVTRQHLDKVHEEQQSIKDQQSKLLEETERNHANLNRITTAPHPKGDNTQRMFHLERDMNHPTCSSVPPTSVGTTFTRSRHLSGSGLSDSTEQSRVTNVTDSHNHPYKVPTHFQVNYINVPNPNKMHAQSSAHQSSSPHGLQDDVAPRMEHNRALLNTSSHLFQRQPANYQNEHRMFSCAEYDMQPVVKQGGIYQPQGSFHPALSQYGEQTRSIRSPLQDHQNVPTSTDYPTNKRPSCYNHFNNKFSSPNYSSSDRQLWSKKNLKPSPVATIAPQAHKEPCNDESLDAHAAQRARKQNRRKRFRREALESNQPQRKSARLSARTSPGNENAIYSSREERKEESRGAGRKSKPKKNTRSCSVAPSVRENESQEDESENEGETATTHWKERVSSAPKVGAHTNNPLKKQPAKMKQVQKRSTFPSMKISKTSTVIARQNDSSDEGDEYSFHDESEDQPSTTFKAFHTLKRSTSCGGEVKHEEQEVFTKRSVITYATPKPMRQRCTPVHASACNERPRNNPTQGRQSIKDSSWQENRVSGQLQSLVAPSQDVDILDAIQIYTQSEDEDSSQEIQFSLVLPDAHDLQRKKNLGPPHWSSIISPSVSSRYTEQVVPDQPQPKKSSKNLTTNRKRRMIYGSRDDLRKTMVQLATPI